MSEAIKVLPIGGLGEIGMNMTLYGCGEDWFAVDAGVQFCDTGTIGAEAVSRTSTSWPNTATGSRPSSSRTATKTTSAPSNTWSRACRSRSMQRRSCAI